MEDLRMMRLDKFLAEMGVGSRQEVKKYIRKGMVCCQPRQMQEIRRQWI